MVFHKVPFFWRFQVHHTDLDLYAASALRFHPIEIIMSLFLEIGFIMVWGIPTSAVLLFEALLSSMAMFYHSNLHLPKALESVLRFLVVTPQMDIIHHSVGIKETDTNFGFNLSIWDRVFKAYTKVFETNGIIGPKDYREVENQRLSRLLTQPF